MDFVVAGIVKKLSRGSSNKCDIYSKKQTFTMYCPLIFWKKKKLKAAWANAIERRNFVIINHNRFFHNFFLNATPAANNEKYFFLTVSSQFWFNKAGLIPVFHLIISDNQVVYVTYDPLFVIYIYWPHIQKTCFKYFLLFF